MSRDARYSIRLGLMKNKFRALTSGPLGPILLDQPFLERFRLRMGRPLTFNRDEALDVAMRVFWSEGYEATSLHDLLYAMNLSKSSFYQSYGGKHELLQRSIHRYSAWVADEMRKRLRQAPSGRAFIEAIFDELTEADDDDLKRGCFVMNCASEFAQSDAVVAGLVMDSVLHFEEVFHQAVERAQVEGDLSPEKDARAVARYLVSSRSGLKTMAKAGAARETLQDIIALVYATLGW